MLCAAVQAARVCLIGRESDCKKCSDGSSQDPVARLVGGDQHRGTHAGGHPSCSAALGSTRSWPQSWQHSERPATRRCIDYAALSGRQVTGPRVAPHAQPESAQVWPVCACRQSCAIVEGSVDSREGLKGLPSDRSARQGCVCSGVKKNLRFVLGGG